MSVLLAILVSFGVGSAYLDPDEKQRIFPTLLGMIFVFSASLSIVRSMRSEEKSDALTGLRLTGISANCVYASKLILGLAVGMFGHIACSILLAGLLDQSLVPVVFEFCVLSLLVIMGYVAIGVTLSGFSLSSKLSAMLLPLTLIPLLFPLLFAAIEISMQLLLDGKLDYGSSWFVLLLVFDIVYLLLGLNLYSFAIGWE